MAHWSARCRWRTIRSRAQFSPDRTSTRSCVRPSRFELLSGETLGPPLDNACSVERRVYYAYRASGGGGLKPLAGSDRPTGRPCGHDHAERGDRAVHRAHRDRHHQPRHLPDRDAARSGERGRAEPLDGLDRLEWATHLRVRRRLRERLVSPGRPHRGRQRCLDARPGLCSRFIEPQCIRQQLQ